MSKVKNVTGQIKENASLYRSILRFGLLTIAIRHALFLKIDFLDIITRTKWHCLYLKETTKQSDSSTWL